MKRKRIMTRRQGILLFRRVLITAQRFRRVSIDTKAVFKADSIIHLGVRVAAGHCTRIALGGQAKIFPRMVPEL
jgi:hypothetical protein